MNTNAEVKIEKDLYVNEATLELLRRRIEAEVKKGFFTWIGAPVGGAGIIAILYVLFSWIPAQLGNMIEEMPSIQRTVQVSVIDYLQDENKGQKFIRDQVDLNSEKFISKEVSAYMNSSEMEGILRAEIAQRTAGFYKSEEGVKLVEKLIKSHMSSPEVRQLIRDAVDKALSPVLGSLSRDIKTSFAAFVYQIPQLAGTEQITKESLQQLIRFLRSSRATAIKSSGSPVVLTFNIGRGHYVEPIIEEYVNRLQESYPQQFKHVAIVSHSRKFVALLPAASFLSAIRENRSLLGILNGTNGASADLFLREKFGPSVGRRIRTTDVVQNVLRSSNLWQPGAAGFVAVVDETGRLVGVTDRRKLIDGCLVRLTAESSGKLSAPGKPYYVSGCFRLGTATLL